MSGGPNAIRHTVRTWLADYGVPSEDADVFMGHKPEGSATGKRYVHRRLEYLRTVVDGVEALALRGAPAVPVAQLRRARA
jgi:integrase